MGGGLTAPGNPAPAIVYPTPLGLVTSNHNPVMKMPFHFFVAALLFVPLHAAELHVALSGKDAAPGTQAAPLRTIQAAAKLAQPGDSITVHAGVYRAVASPTPNASSIRRPRVRR